MSTRVTAWIAWSVWALSASSAVLGILFLYLNDISFTDLSDEAVGPDTAVAVTYSTVGAIIASGRPRNVVGWLFCAIGLFQGVAVLGGEYAKYALVTEPNSLPGGVAAAWLGSWAWLPGVVLTVTFLLLLFPHGRLPSRRWRPVAWLAAGVTSLGVVILATAPWDLLGVDLPAHNPFEIESVGSFGSTLAIPLFILGAMSALLSALSLILRFRRSRGEERQQLKWFVYAGVLYILTILVPLPAISNLQILTAPFLPIAAGVAILRYRLYDIDVLINRTLVYGSLTAMLALVYVGSVVGLQLVLRALTGQESTLAIVASTLAIAALFGPLRRRVQAFVDRRFYRHKYDAAKTLAAFSGRLRDETELDALSADLIRVVRRTMQPEHVTLWLRPEATQKVKRAD